MNRASKPIYLCAAKAFFSLASPFGKAGIEKGENTLLLALTVWAFLMLTYFIVFPDVAFEVRMKLAKRFSPDNRKRRSRKGGRR